MKFTIDEENKKFQEFFGMTRYEFGRKIAEEVDRQIEMRLLTMHAKIREQERAIKQLQLMVDQTYIKKMEQTLSKQRDTSNDKSAKCTDSADDG